ncbi:MAG: ArsR family transcriptional regulator [Dehalococcoidia bacterium]
MAAHRDEHEPAFLRLAGHPLRWRLMRELSRSDLRVRELTLRLGQPQSLVSYHLARLRQAGLVSMRRSSADSRDAYYSLELLRCRESVREVEAALHPGLDPARAVAPITANPRVTKCRVLFLCTGNSARSQIAEAFTRRLGAEWVEAYSAGREPKPLHPQTVRVVRKHRIDMRHWRTKHMDEFADQQFDYVVTLCDRVRETCPEFPGRPTEIHWSIPDPAASDELASAFEQAATAIETRVRFLLALIANDVA